MSSDIPDERVADATRRRYDGSGRQRDAAQRRARMLDAARELFLEQGYGTTSIEQVAQRAGTSAQTVYAAFGNKPGLLRRVIDVAVGGDDEDIKLMDRPEHAGAFELADLRARMRLVAGVGAAAHQRSGELVCLVEGVAGTDPAVRELAEDLHTQLRTEAERFIDAIPSDQLRSDLGRDRLVDVAALLGTPSGWHTLVVERGWSQDEYVDWFADALWRNLVDES